MTQKTGDIRTEIPIHVHIRTVLNSKPLVYASFGDFIKNNMISGGDIPIGKKAENGIFHLMANEQDRSVNINRVPAQLTFSFNIPEESSTSYVVRFPSTNPENFAVTITKKSQSRFPETIQAAMFQLKPETFDTPIPLVNNLPKNVQVMNDFVHPWKIKVEYKIPDEKSLPEYFIEINEIDPSTYLKGDELFVWNILKDRSPSHLNNSFNLSQKIFNDNPFHITLLHLAVRFRNTAMI